MASGISALGADSEAIGAWVDCLAPQADRAAIKKTSRRRESVFFIST